MEDGNGNMASWLCQDIMDHEKRGQKTSNSHQTHVGPISFHHGHCKNFQAPCSAPHGICWGREEGGAPSWTALADLPEHKRIDLMVQNEAVEGGNSYYAS